MNENNLFIPLALPEDLTSELAKEYDNEETLDLLERGAISHSHESFKNDTEASKYIFYILYHRIWRHRLNEDGTYKYFRDGRFSQELYLPDLQRKVRWGRASIFDKFKAMKFAINGLDIAPEQIDEYGGVKMFIAAEKEVSSNGKISPKTGKIVQFNKDTNGVDAKTFILEGIKRLSPENTDDMTPSQIRDALRNHLSDKAKIWFELVTITRGYDRTGYETRWCREQVQGGILDHQNGLMSEPGIPADVLAEYCKRLRTKNPLQVYDPYKDEHVGQEENSAPANTV